MKHVHSSDPRKKTAAEALKLQTGATKITNMAEDKAFIYGNCLQTEYINGRLGYKRLGRHSINKSALKM